MNLKDEINALQMKLGLEDDELITHKKAHEVFSRTGSDKVFKHIPQEKRDRIAEFYKTLRAWGVHNYRPDIGTFQKTCGYLAAWVHILKNDPHRPEMENVTEEEVRTLIQNGLNEIHAKMHFRRKKGNIGGAVAGRLTEIRKIAEIVPDHVPAAGEEFSGQF